jgi:hypothetical protein
VTDEDVNGQRFGFEFFQQSIAEITDPSARIEYDQMVS